MIADEVFGESNFINHIIWSYKTGGVPERVGFSKKHDDILLYSKSSKPIFNRQQQRSYVASLPEPHTKSGQKLGVQRDPNCEFCATGQPGPKYRQVVCRDHWSDIPALYRNSAERCNYPTQKPEALLSRMISASSTKKSLVLDPFCGSGTTLAAARALGRNYIGIDCNPVAIQCSANRLLPTVDFQRWRDPQAQIKNCSAEFEIKENRIFLVKYHDQDGQELNPEQWLISIWIDCNYTGIFSPTLFSKRPVLTEWILPEEWGIIEIEVVDAKGAIWKGQIN
jgi:DNA modification methylase